MLTAEMIVKYLEFTLSENISQPNYGNDDMQPSLQWQKAYDGPGIEKSLRALIMILKNGANE